MKSISQTQEERVFAEVKRLSLAGLDGLELLGRTAGALRRAIPFAAYCGNTTDPASRLMTRGVAEGLDGAIDAAVADEMGRVFLEQIYFEEELDEITAMQRSGRAATSLFTMTDGKPEKRLRYRELLRPSGFSDEVGMIFDDRGLWGSMEIMRERGGPVFGSREIEIARRIAPHVASGLKAAALRARALQVQVEGCRDDVPGVLVIDAAGRIVSSTPAAERLLAELEPNGPGWHDGPPLPIPVMMVLGALQRTLQPDTDAAAHRIPRLRLRSRAGRWLTLHADLTEPACDRPSERIVVIAPAAPNEVAWLTLAAYELTPREEEIVRLIVGGLSTRQIGDRLFIAEHTVQRHLTNIFEKVGVRSRRALVKQLFFEQMLPRAGVA